MNRARKAGRDEDAAAALRQALAIAPHHADARAALATTLARMGRTKDATREIAAALEDRTLPLETKLAAVEALHAVGRSAEAADLFSRYLRLMPSDARGWAPLARAQESAGDLRGSHDALQRAVDRAPDNETARRALDEFLLRHPELTE